MTWMKRAGTKGVGKNRSQRMRLASQPRKKEVRERN